MMLFFTILSILVLINVFLLAFSINKTSKVGNQKNVVIRNVNNVESEYSQESSEHDIVYKEAI